MTIEYLSASLSQLLNKGDELTGIQMEVQIEIILEQVNEKGYLEIENFVDLSLIGVPIIHYLMKYKNISSLQAKRLIKYEYVTFEDLLKILEFGIRN